MADLPNLHKRAMDDNVEMSVMPGNKMRTLGEESTDHWSLVTGFYGCMYSVGWAVNMQFSLFHFFKWLSKILTNIRHYFKTDLKKNKPPVEKIQF